MDEFAKSSTYSSAKKIDKYHYNLHDIIGQGSFATVYLGKDIENNELRAIKVINTSSMQKEKDQAIMLSLINEIKIIKSLDNPNIIKCYDVLSTPNNTYLVMDYCEGGDLKSYLRKSLRLSEEKALSILKQVLNGYKELYKHGIIHRDLKAENILIKNDTFKLGDFGFAKMLNNFEKDVLKSLVGTPLYMSPQILKQEDYTSKSDIWSIGIIYYEMLFGKTPWDSISNHDLLKRILKNRVEFPAGIFLSENSRNFIEGCLQVEESQRLSWGEVYSHDLFEDCFNFRRKRTMFEIKMNKIGARLGNIAKNKSIDLVKLFRSIDNNKNGRLEMDEFTRLLSKIDPSLTREQIEYIFNRVDADSSGYIDFPEFEKWLAAEEKSESEQRIMDNSAKINSFQASLNAIQLQLRTKNDLLQETLEKKSEKTMTEEQFLSLFKAIDSSIQTYDLKEVFKGLATVNGCVEIRGLKKMLAEERIIKHRVSELQSPIIQQLLTYEIPKTQSFHSTSEKAQRVPSFPLLQFKK